MQSTTVVGLTSMFLGGVRSSFSLCCNATWEDKSMRIPLKMKNEKKNKKKKVWRPTWSVSLTTLSCLKASLSFSLWFSMLLLPDELTVDPQQKQATSRQNPSSFMSVSNVWCGWSPEAFSYRKIYWKCAACCHSPFYTYPWGDRKTTRRELESCRNCRLWLTKFLFHWQSPLRDPRVSSRWCACMGPPHACERKETTSVRARPTGRTTLPILTLNQWSPQPYCVIGGCGYLATWARAPLQSRPPTQLPLQQQEARKESAYDQKLACRSGDLMEGAAMSFFFHPLRY